MSRERTLNVAKAVTSQLHVTEEAIDSALAEAAHLLETCISSRRAIRMSTLLTTEVNDSTIEAMKALHTAQTHMAQAHRTLTKIQDQLGLDDTLMPPPFDKPPEDPPKEGVTQSRLARRRQLAAGQSAIR
ncbi:hypothetical protein [Asticcacaulis sp. AC402]|uniref:hypothetical protein n=1 Tax=Asticcacaulis sp. AC402 TaxID=1282361 RepID=UPI0003C3F768|nr:hypothetical protein [Asticcacaulis sp. AC402]ESQ77675.1 hypothetical protein ABAC402_00675 [Asticcacaulis sp. AC402]